VYAVEQEINNIKPPGLSEAAVLQLFYSIQTTNVIHVLKTTSMPVQLRWVMLPVLFGLASVSGLAHSYGPPPRVTGAPGDNAKACTQCHTTFALNSGKGTVNLSLPGGPVYIPGVKQRITVFLSDPAQQRWGFEMSARLNSDLANGQAGDFSPIDNLTQVICEDAGPKPCLSGVQFIQHTSAGTRNGTKPGVSFTFDWTPPATNAGSVTLYLAANEANGDGNLTGDYIYTTSVQLDPVAAKAPAVTGSIVSSATFASGAVAANSWVTIYGTDLGVTTRSWNSTDFTNGAYPTSLDGVSVILTAFGAPRLGYIGYVSPTQLNVLLPSDTNSTTVQVQVKNAAGVTPQTPLLVQSNVPQLLTGDGKFVLAAHADGSAVGKASPAAPGETISLYGTGCGPTAPALIPGQVPVTANPLVTLPSVTIGGSTAAVASGTVVAGSGGVYQINVQIPASAANGDLPVLMALGGTNSVASLITVQR
jgi:uncharacterized protein (TIGR03437 family)